MKLDEKRMRIMLLGYLMGEGLIEVSEDKEYTIKFTTEGGKVFGSLLERAR